MTGSFASSPEQKTARMLHTRLLERFMPEWAAVPYVSGSMKSTAARVWDGDGMTAVCDLLDTAQGDVANLRCRPAVEQAAARRVEKSVPAPLPAPAVRLAFVKRTRVGRRVWTAVRSQVVARVAPDKRR